VQVWASEEDLKNYKEGLRKELMEKMGSCLDSNSKDGYDIANKVFKGVKHGSAVTDTSVVRIVGYKYKTDKTGEIDDLMDKNWPTMAAAGISAYSFFKDDSKTEGYIAMCCPSQEFLDEYKKTTRETLMKEMGDIMDGGPTFEDVSPLLKA